MRIAQAQINPTVGDLAANTAMILDYMAQARQAQAGVVCFPELAVCGYPPEDLLLKPRFLADARAAVERLALAARGVTAVVGFPLAEGGVVRNAAAVLAEGRVAAVYRKIELPNYGVFDERRYFAAGDECLILDMGGTGVLVSICEDVWLAGNQVERVAAQAGVGLTINISGSPFHAGKLGQRLEILGGFARRSGAAMCYANLVGGQDELVFDGGSMIIDPDGQLSACAPRFIQGLYIHDLELPTRPPRPTPGATIVHVAAPAAPSGKIAAQTRAPELNTEDEVLAALGLGLADYVRKNGFGKVTLGLSGGIDSALTAAVAVSALGAQNVVGVTMPSQYTSGETLSDAQLLAANLGVELLTVPLKGVYDVFIDQMRPALGPGPLGVEAENLQARIRGAILMTLSNRFGWLVLTTGNKSETAVGYCTLYGDMAGGFALIKDVPKTLVYRLARRVNQRAGRELIPASTIERPPSAELRPDQKDTDSLPEYDVLDPILQAYVEQDMVLDEIAALGLADKDVVAKVVRMVDLNEYKRRQAPPGVKITPKAFGRDRRLPITNRYRPGWESQ